VISQALRREFEEFFGVAIPFFAQASNPSPSHIGPWRFVWVDELTDPVTESLPKEMLQDGLALHKIIMTRLR
jgi:hypothetical protein